MVEEGRRGDLRQGTLLFMLLMLIASPLTFGSDATPPAILFALPPPSLRSASQNSGRKREPEMASEVDLFELQTRKASDQLSLSLQRHEAMNGKPLLQSALPPTSGLRRTFDLLLPAKGSVFQKNPNVLRDPLKVDGW